METVNQEKTVNEDKTFTQELNDLKKKEDIWTEMQYNLAADEAHKVAKAKYGWEKQLFEETGGKGEQ